MYFGSVLVVSCLILLLKDVGFGICVGVGVGVIIGLWFFFENMCLINLIVEWVIDDNFLVIWLVKLEF